MKSLVSALCFASIGTIGYSAEKSASQTIYEKLKVSEFSIAKKVGAEAGSIVGQQVFEKTVSDFHCNRSAPVIANPTFEYTCFLSIAANPEKLSEPKQLWDAIDVKASYLIAEGFPSVKTGTKKLAGITCAETTVDGAENATYNCNYKK